MLNRTVLAYHISNLSDARYFAAYDVDYMAFVLSPDGSNISDIKEMTSWVEGPKFLLQLDEWNDELVRFVSRELDFGGFVLPFDQYNGGQTSNTKPLWLDDAPLNTPAAELLFPIYRLPAGHDQALPSESFINLIDLTTEEASNILARHPGQGMVLSGGEEERVGVKSFEDQDALIELLMD